MLGTTWKHRCTKLQKDTLHELQELTVGETDERTKTIWSVMKATTEEHRSCKGKRTSFPCIVPGLMLWEHRGGVTNPTETGGG